MANLVNYTIPNLIQGVSQQPDAQRDPSQGEKQINGMSSIAEGLRKRDCTITLAKVSETAFGDAFFHSILRDKNEQFLSVITDSSVQIFDLQGTAQTVNVDAAAGTYLSSVQSAKSDIRAVTIADYTFVSNLRVTPAMKADTWPDPARPTAHECLLWIKQANYGQTYVVNVNGSQTSVETAVAPVVTEGSTTTENRISSEEIAEEFRVAIDGLADVTATRQGAVVWIQSANPITIEATDARSNTDITAILDKVQVFTELPTIAPEGYQVEIEGDPGNNFDNYYVAFEPRNGTFNEGSWLESVQPGLQFRIEEDTMPQLLIRKPDGTFYFGPADGRQLSGNTPSAWTLDVPSWGDRVAGNDGTAELPTFLKDGGRAISDIGIYKNRLYFLSDEAIVLSRAGDFFEFFPSTVTAVLDDDPIDIVASNNRVSVLRYAVPYQDELILFSDQYQFRFNAADTSLTPRSAQITVLTQFDVDTGLRPQQAGGGILFGQMNGDWERIREFSVRGAGTALTADAADLTSYVSTFVPKDTYAMTVNDTGNMVFMISSRNDGAGPGQIDFRDRIYVYKYFYRNSGQQVERAQSSWSYWTFPSAVQVLQVLCVNEVLYLLTQYGTEVFLEKMSVTDRLGTDNGAPYPLLLDRRTDSTNNTPAALRVTKGAFDAVKKETEITIKYTAVADVEIWSGFNMGYDKDDPTKTWLGPRLLGKITAGNTSAKVSGNYENADVFCGEVIKFEYRFTRFKLVKEIGGGRAATNSTRTQVRSAKLRYHETAWFKATTKPQHREKGEYIFDATEIAVRASAIGNPPTMDDDIARYYEGVFNIPVMSKGEQCIVEVESDKPHPCKFSTCEWVGLLTGRSRSLE